MRGGRFSLVILVGVFGVFLPLQSGAEWVQSPATVFYWGWVPLMLVGGAVADSFAGERERHTLETLLASRLPDARHPAREDGARQSRMGGAWCW